MGGNDLWFPMHAAGHSQLWVHACIENKRDTASFDGAKLRQILKV